jgi:hypothetical protein
MLYALRGVNMVTVFLSSQVIGDEGAHLPPAHMSDAAAGVEIFSGIGTA